MKDDLRAVVAAIAASHSRGVGLTHIYDYSTGSHKTVQISFNGDTLNGYDYSRSSHITGTLPSLYWYGDNHHLTMTPQGAGRYDGYDYGSSRHFTVTVNGSSVSIYDYETSTYHNYS